MNYFHKDSSTLEIIKYLAIVSMTIDHAGIILFDENEIMRAYGRFAYIAFAFLLAYHYRYNTHDKFQYQMRLLKWAFISQVPYSLALGIDAGLNIMFLLYMSINAINLTENLLQKTDSRKEILFNILDIFTLSALILLTYFTGYFIFGVLIIIFFYYTFENKAVMPFLLISAALLNGLSIIYAVAGVISVLIIYNLQTSLKLKRINKYYFYAFYPLHLIILWLISRV